MKKINPLGLAKFQAKLFALLGLFAGILYSFGGLVLDSLVSAGWITSSETPGLSYGTVLAFGALIAMPIIFAVIGVVTGFVGALLLIVLARCFEYSTKTLNHKKPKTKS